MNDTGTNGNHCQKHPMGGRRRRCGRINQHKRTAGNGKPAHARSNVALNMRRSGGKCADMPHAPGKRRRQSPACRVVRRIAWYPAATGDGWVLQVVRAADRRCRVKIIGSTARISTRQTWRRPGDPPGVNADRQRDGGDHRGLDHRRLVCRQTQESAHTRIAATAETAGQPPASHRNTSTAIWGATNGRPGRVIILREGKP